MKLLLNCHVSQDFDECNQAFLDVTPELAQDILKCKRFFDSIFGLDGSLCEMHFYDCAPVFLSGLPEKLEASLDYGEDFVEIDAAVEDFENFAARTECDRMVITRTDVYWEAIVKHTDVRVETRPIGYADIEKVPVPAEVSE